jgi:hypothetical protein
MSLYIHEENQELLWNIINKNPQIQQYFLSYPPNIKENWFKQIILSFYEQNRNIIVSQEQLLDINKNTILYMINDIKRNIQYKEEQKKQQGFQTDQTKNTEYLKPYSVTENKEDKFKEQFQQYQNNYNSMFDKKLPESVDFREKINDPQISNMDELIQRHLRERDEELKRYAPAPIFANSTSSLSEPKNIQSSNRITIDKNSSNINLSVEEFREPEINQQKNTDYTVKWLDNENSNEIKNLQKEVNDLKKIVLQLSNKIFEDKDIKEPNLYKLSGKPKLSQDQNSQYLGTIIGNILLNSERITPLKINSQDINLTTNWDEEYKYNIKDIKNTRGYL